MININESTYDLKGDNNLDGVRGSIYSFIHWIKKTKAVETTSPFYIEKVEENGRKYIVIYSTLLEAFDVGALSELLLEVNDKVIKVIGTAGHMRNKIYNVVKEEYGLIPLHFRLDVLVLEYEETLGEAVDLFSVLIGMSSWDKFKDLDCDSCIDVFKLSLTESKDFEKTELSWVNKMFNNINKVNKEYLNYISRLNT